MYSKVLMNSIEREKSESIFRYSQADRSLLNELLKEINKFALTNFEYLAELDAFDVHGSGEIISRYISKFESETIRCYLIPQIVSDRIADCDKLILQSYLHFRESDEYISQPGKPAPAHIYIRYDNAFRILKPKRLKFDLLKLAENHRDAFYLPFTMRMLASWKLPEMKNILESFLIDTTVTYETVDIPEGALNIFPPLDFIKTELMFTAIDGLRHFPTKDVAESIRLLLENPDTNIQQSAKRAIGFIERRL